MKKMYRYVVQLEFVFFHYYKTEPFTMMSNMTMIDLYSFFDRLEYQAKEDAKNKQGNKLMKSLVAIRDILNTMTLPNS